MSLIFHSQDSTQILENEPPVPLSRKAGSVNFPQSQSDLTLKAYESAHPATVTD